MATVIQNIDGNITVSVPFTLEGDMPEMKSTILDAVNDMGVRGDG